jgi:predicted metal-dependent RNase
VLQRNGCILIPVFALGRTQEILGLLALLMRSGKIKEQPIYIGGLGRVLLRFTICKLIMPHRQHSALQLRKRSI